MSNPRYVLSLDGGGSLGVYTLGVLVEIERMLNRPLHEVFDLLYGTSTGSIIASMIALGDDVEATIKDRYFEVIPDVMGKWFPWTRSHALHRHAKDIYGEKRFDSFLTNIGIVATHVEYNRPMVFKRTENQAHGRTASFEPGFGCKISDAVIASSAAYPIFTKKQVLTSNSGPRTVIDGGFCGNNPALFAITDAVGPLGIEPNDLRLLSIGTGQFPERFRLTTRALTLFAPTLTSLLQTSSNTVEILQTLLFPHIQTLRINEAKTSHRYRTDFIENNPRLLTEIFDLGRESFALHEKEIRQFFGIEQE